MSAISDAVKAIDDRAEKEFVVPEWNDVKLLLISPTSIERSKMISAYTKSTADEATGEIVSVIDQGAMMPAVVVACAHDPETRERAFAETDVEWLSLKNGAVVERIGLACMPLVGFAQPGDDGPTDTGKDDSSTTLDGDTPSS